MRDVVVLSGSLHPELTKLICRHLTTNEGEVLLTKFANGETLIEIKESVREKDVFIVQLGCGHVNDNLIELLIMLLACKTASAKRVTAVLPLFPYSRQPDIPHLAALTGAPKKTTFNFELRPPTRALTPAPGDLLAPRSPKRTDSTTKISAPNPIKGLLKNIATTDAAGRTELGYKQWIAQNGTLIANLLTRAGADRVITMDLHDPQFQGYFDICVDNLHLKPLFKNWIIEHIPNYHQCVIVLPDSGGAKRAIAVADALGCPFALIHKERRAKYGTGAEGTPDSNPKVVATTMLVGDVKDKVCVLVDDLVDTAYTITQAAKLLKDQGAKQIYALVAHGIFSGEAIRRIEHSAIDKLVTTNLTPLQPGANFEVLDVLRVFAEAIRRIHNGESVSMLFDHGW